MTITDVSNKGQYSLSINGAQFCSSIRSLSLQRRLIQFEVPPSITGTIVLEADDLIDDITGNAINPNPEIRPDFWGPYTPVTFSLKDDAGNPVPPPFGRETRIKSASFVPRQTGLRGSTVTQSTLTIEVVDVLQYHRQREGAYIPEGFVAGVNANVLTPLNTFLSRFNLEFNLTKSATPTRTSQLAFRFPGLGHTIPDFIHSVLMGSADNEYQPYLAYVDNDEDIVVRALNFSPTGTSEYTLTDEQLAFCAPITAAGEQLPGTVAGKAYYVLTTFGDSSISSVAFLATGGRIVSETTYGNPIVQSTTIYDVDQDATGVFAGSPVKQQVERTETHYSSNREDYKIKTLFRRRSDYGDTGVLANNLVAASQVRTDFTYRSNSLLRRRNTLTSELEGRLATQYPDVPFLDPESFNLIRRHELVEEWVQTGTDEFDYKPIAYSFIKGDEAEAPAPQSGQGQSRPPAAVTYPDRTLHKEINYTSNAQVFYNQEQTVINPKNLNINGTFVGVGGGSFTGFGTLTEPGGTTEAQGNNITWNGNATLSGIGILTASGTFTGFVNLGRTREADFENYPAGQFELDVLTTMTAQIIAGEYFGQHWQLSLDAAGGQEVPPCSTFDDPNGDTYMLTGELIEIERETVLWGGSALKLGSRAADGTLTLIANLAQRYLSMQDGTPIADQNGDPIFVRT